MPKAKAKTPTTKGKSGAKQSTKAPKAKATAAAKPVKAGKAKAPKGAKAKAVAKPATKKAGAGAPKGKTASTTLKNAKAANTNSRGDKVSKALKTSPAPANANGKAGTATDLKARFSALSQHTKRIGKLKRSIGRTFFEVGGILNQIKSEKLYEVKGYGAFDKFVDREIELNTVTCLRACRIAEVMIEKAALEAGLERCSAAVAALDGETDSAPQLRPMGAPAGSMLPLHKQ